MCVLWSALNRETTKRKILQPFLLSAGDGSNSCRRNLRVVWEEVYRHQWTGAAVLQPELCHSGPEYSKKTARRAKTLGDEGGGGTLAREADRSGPVQWSRETREVGAVGVRNDQYVHGIGRAAGHYPLPSEVRPYRWERLCISRRHRHDAEISGVGWAELPAGKAAGVKWGISLARRAAGKRSGIERERVYLFVEQINCTV